MFTIYHIIWIIICAVIIGISLYYIHAKKISVKQILPACCVVCVVSEVLKVFSALKMVPSADGTMYYPYLELQHLPLHMCSLLIFVIFYCTYSTNTKFRTILLGFLYPAGLLGGIAAILLPSIFQTSIKPSEAFISPMAYQTFLYHTMLIVLAITILWDKESGLSFKNFKTTLLLAGVMCFVSLYLNSMFATAVYKDSVLQSVEYTTNFFFTYRTPIGLKLTTITQWYIYFGVLILVAVLLVFICYIPFLKRKKN